MAHAQHRTTCHATLQVDGQARTQMTTHDEGGPQVHSTKSGAARGAAAGCHITVLPVIFMPDCASMFHVMRAQDALGHPGARPRDPQLSPSAPLAPPPRDWLGPRWPTPCVLLHWCYCFSNKLQPPLPHMLKDGAVIPERRFLNMMLRCAMVCNDLPCNGMPWCAMMRHGVPWRAVA